MSRNVEEKTGRLKQRASARQILAICLALIMFFGSALAFDQAIAFQMQQSPSNEMEFFDEWGLLEEWNLEYLDDFWLDDATNWEEWTSYEEIALFYETMSENRRNYFKLLEGRYNNYQLRQRFVELFGDGFSGEYIFHNYRTIFDLPKYKEIVSAFLRVLSGYRVDFRFQNADNHNMRSLASEDGKVRIFPDGDLSDAREFANAEDATQEFDAEFLERIMNDLLEPEKTYCYKVSDLQYDNAYILFDADRQGIEAFSSNLLRLNIWSVANTSITVDMWFANNTWANNVLQIWEPGTNQWRWVISQGARTGTHTITGLSPGVTYFIAAGTWDSARQMWVHVSFPVTTTLPAPNLISHSRSSVDFRLDRTFTDALGVSLTNSFLDATNQAFYSIRTLVGGPPFYHGGRMQIDHVRNLYWQHEGMSGWPIRWQLTNVHGDGVLVSLDHAQRMRATGIETTEIPIHEIGHNFDNWRWSFEPEAIAILFTYYYYATTNRRMVNAGDPRTFRGGEFRTYMRSYAYRAMGFFNHQEAMRWGVYSPYSMAYVLGGVAGQIGWQPFTNTFIHFHSLEMHEVPQTNLGKLNLFLSMLTYYSGRDVFAMIPADARFVYQQFFGGQLRYVPVPDINTITHPYHNQRVAWSTLVVRWRTIVSATHEMCLFNLDQNRYIISRRSTGILNWDTIRQDQLVPGERYRIYVRTTLDGRSIMRTRNFSVRDDIIVPTGVSINPSGFIRLLVNPAEPVRYRTRQFTANVSPANATDRNVTWLIGNSSIAEVSPSGLVTARAPGATTVTVRTNSGNRSASATIDVGVVLRGAVEAYRNMGIGWPLGERREPGHIDYITGIERRDFNVVSSRFGTRPPYRHHMGMDIQHPNGGEATQGIPVLAAVSGRVAHVDIDADTSIGFSIAIRTTDPRYRDPVTGQQLIFVHHHLRCAPCQTLLFAGAPVMRGQIIGFAGNTGAEGTSDGHLHFEITNNGRFDWSGGIAGTARNRINPRFFFPMSAFVGTNERTASIWQERNFTDGPPNH